MSRDSASEFGALWSRPALADTILIFRKPGDNAVAVTHDTPASALTNDEWIEWARPIWYGIRESDTLNVAVAREDKDERHICPLQLGTIERCIRLWSNPGDLVLSPFAGIGSEGYEAVRLGRRYLGFELKPSYANTAAVNLRAAVASKTQGTLFATEADDMAEIIPAHVKTTRGGLRIEMHEERDEHRV